jgi:hypothetical protein
MVGLYGAFNKRFVETTMLNRQYAIKNRQRKRERKAIHEQ